MKLFKSDSRAGLIAVYFSRAAGCGEIDNVAASFGDKFLSEGGRD